MLADNIKTLRKQSHLSQEQLAEKLNVSRQAVTKWETGVGIPDIENLKALSLLFHTSLDDLLETGHISETPNQDYAYESITEYDIADQKHYDIAFGGAKTIAVLGYPGEKIRVRLASDTITNIQRVLKVKIDDVKKRIDVTVTRLAPLTEAQTKDGLHITLWLPQSYTNRVELSGNAEQLTITKLTAEDFEFTGKLHFAELSEVIGQVDLNSNEDMTVRCVTLSGRVDINQVSATSRLYLPEKTAFTARLRGIANHIYYEKGGSPCPDFSSSPDDSDNIIELNGVRSELIITEFVPTSGTEQ